MPGSAGCIDLTSNMDSFIKQLRADYKDIRNVISLLPYVIQLIKQHSLAACLPRIAYTEVSGKAPSFLYIWMIGLGAALLCVIAGRFLRRRLVPVAVAFPALWFLSLFMEIQSADVGPALYAEQGGVYYLHAYSALAAMAGGAAWGWWRGRS